MHIPPLRLLASKLSLLLFVFLLAPVALIASDDAARIEQLRAEIARHDDLYYKSATPEISDTEYDALKRELRELEAANPALASRQSPTRRVAGDGHDSFFKRRSHIAPMLSLENTYDENAVRAFDRKIRKQLASPPGAVATLQYVVEPKIDGAGINIVYENGKLTQVVTRGDGAEGDNIVANVRAARALPEQLVDDGNGLPSFIEIRGEIYMPLADFNRINAQRAAGGRPLYANARNLAAGSMKLHDPAEVARRGLRVFVYGIGACEPGAGMRKPIASQGELHARFRAWGLPVMEKTWVADSPEKLLAAINELSAMRPQLAYLIDGAVIKVDGFAAQNRLGSGSTAPNWAIAYKYSPRSVETRVRAITLQVGRTGAITPVAELEPVMLAGTKITRASLHNPREMVRKGIGVGDIVVIEKAGEIIPEIVRVKTEARSPENPIAPFSFPKNCPECGTPLVGSGDAGDEIANRCPNTQCAGQVKRRIAHFASKQCVNISGLGEATVGKLVDGGLVRDAAGLYELEASQIAKTIRSEKTAARLHASIAASRRADLWRVIAGLGIPDAGAATARALAKKYDSLAAFIAADEASLAAISGVNKKSAASVAAWLADPANRALVERLDKHGLGARKR
ncbi:DNA ligase (NAD+) [Ereboglobus sp. PH5-5]|uniref:NAD-dependent DNA ligase LigA n=1 Tax=Ereboglobus sp. PH5-5 TaxID=2940529 RepID=UPI0024067995|nr:NAD-dependent DNA ligase LigA [Ereboglobus sp. PH5-5]MDF9834117.1 DNA ligase (NAD+) [Ereboglobus sp. PH5-5]